MAIFPLAPDQTIAQMWLVKWSWRGDSNNTILWSLLHVYCVLLHINPHITEPLSCSD